VEPESETETATLVCSVCDESFEIVLPFTVTCEHCGKDVNITIPRLCPQCETENAILEVKSY
jgi:transcription elongation factor Elf1